jgi:hypothetical protein
MRTPKLLLAALLLAAAPAYAVPTAREGLPLEIAAGGGHVGMRMEHSGAFQLMMRHRLPESRVDTFWNVTGGGDEIYRYNDECRMPLGTFMPQHSTGRPGQRKVLNDQALAWAGQYRTLPRYDVLFLGGAPFVKRYRDNDEKMKTPDLLFDRSAEMQQQVIDFVRSGKTLVLTGPTNNFFAPSYKTETGTVTRAGQPPLPLEALFTFTPVTDAPALAEPIAGIPFEWFAAWPDGLRGKNKPPVPPGGALLTRRTADGKSVPVGSTWTLGKGRIYYFPMAVTASTFLFAKDLKGGVDADEASLRLWEQLAYRGTYGAKAYPVMAEVPAVLSPVPAGRESPVRLRLLGEPAVTLRAELRGAGPDGAVEWTGSLDVAAGPDREVTLNVAVPLTARGGRHPLAVDVLSADGAVLYHQALSTVTVAPGLEADVASDRPGYATGEPVRLTVSARNYSPQATAATATVTVFDLDGRALMQASQPLALPAAPPPANAAPAKGRGKVKELPPPAPGEAAVTFEWTLPPTALRAYTFWTRAEVRAGDGPAAAAGGKFYRSEKWNTRSQLVWGIKNFEGMRSRESLAPFMRTVAASGMNSVNWNLPTEALERRGWFGDLEWGKPWIRASQVKFLPEGGEDVLRAHFRQVATQTLAGDPLSISPAVAIASIGEESGYGGGWGTLWEWYNRPAKPEGTNAFHRYLATRYADVAALNASWSTAFASFSEIPLEEKYVAIPAQIDGQPVLAAPRQARYVDTRQFFMARARMWAALAQEEFRKVLPSPMTVYGYGNYLGQPTDLKTEPGMIDPPDQPGFTMAWWPYADLHFMRGTMWGFLAAHVGHQAGYNADQCINYDLGLSPVSVATWQFMNGVGAAAPLLLNAHPFKTSAVGQMNTWQPRLSPAGNNLLPAALREAGMPALTSVESNTPPDMKFLHVTDALRITEPRARLVREFVERGGTALIALNFALEDDHGNLYPALPGLGLETLVGVRQSQPVGRGNDHGETTLATGAAPAPIPTTLTIKVEGRDRSPTLLPGTTVLVSYADGVPAITVRAAGKGVVYWVNAVKPGGDYEKLLLALVRSAGVETFYEGSAADGPAARDLFVVPYANDDGRVLTFACIRRGGTTGQYTLTLHRPGYRFFNASTGRPLPTLSENGKSVVAFHIEPAAGVILAAVPYDVEARLAAPAAVTAGEKTTVTLSLQARGDTIGQHVATLSATGPGGKPFPAFGRTVALTGEARVELAAALNDAPGAYTLTLTDLATGAAAKTQLEVKAPPALAHLPAFRLDWPSESLGPRQIGDDRFVAELGRLASLYLGPGGDRLTHWYYQQGHGDTRYNLVQALAAVDWRKHAAALRKAIENGQTVVLVGEDMGFSPSLHAATYPHNEGGQLEALDQVAAGVTPREIKARPSLRLYPIGKGQLILDRQSWDEYVWKISETAAFRTQWLADVKALQAGGAAAPVTPVSRWFFESKAVLARAAERTEPGAGRETGIGDADPNAPWAPAKADQP